MTIRGKEAEGTAAAVRAIGGTKPLACGSACLCLKLNHKVKECLTEGRLREDRHRPPPQKSARRRAYCLWRTAISLPCLAYVLRIFSISYRPTLSLALGNCERMCDAVIPSPRNRRHGNYFTKLDTARFCFGLRRHARTYGASGGDGRILGAREALSTG